MWRRPGYRFIARNIAQINALRAGSIMVWSDISHSGRTGLHVLRRGSMTVERYIDKILESSYSQYYVPKEMI